MQNFSFGLLGQFETILPDEKPMPPEYYLKGIDRNTLMRIGTSLIRHDPIKSEFREWKALLNMWFKPANQEFKNYVWVKSQELSNHFQTPISFLFPPAGLKFFELAFNMTLSETTQDELASEVNLFKAYLYFISEITKRETVDEAFLEKIPEPDRAAYLILHQQFPIGEFINYQLYDIFLCQMIKSCMLFEFLENKPEAKSLLDELYQYFGLNNWKEYLKNISPLVKAETQKMNSSWTDINITKNDDYNNNCFFLDALSLKVLDEELNADFKLLRGNPIYKKEEGLYSIIYPLILVEKIFKGLFFHFKVLFDGMSLKQIDNWNRFYTKDFAESYLLYNIFEYIYGKRSYVRFTGDQMDEKLKNKGGVDYYIRNGNKIFLFESKSVFINADIKQSGNIEQLIEELKTKFYYDENDNRKPKPKAVRQLIRNVSRIIKMENEFDTNYNPENVSIYPIVVVHDTSFNVPGLNYLINNWFQQELLGLSNAGINVNKVKMLSVVNIDTFIMYADYLRLKKKTFSEILDTYLATRVYNEKRKYKDSDHQESAFGETLLPFSAFMDIFTDVGYKKVPNSLWQSVAIKLFPH